VDIHTERALPAPGAASEIRRERREEITTRICHTRSNMGVALYADTGKCLP
jgi:hypothetical protein